MDVIADPDLQVSNILEINPRIPACYAHYYKNGCRMLSSLVDGACKLVPNSSPKATQYVALDAARISALGFVGLAEWVRDLVNPNVQTYEFFKGDVRGAILGSVGQLSRMRKNMSAKKTLV